MDNKIGSIDWEACDSCKLYENGCEQTTLNTIGIEIDSDWVYCKKYEKG